MNEFVPTRSVTPADIVEEFDAACGDDEETVTLPLVDFQRMERFQAWLVEALLEAKTLIEEATAHPKKVRDGVRWRRAKKSFLDRVRPLFQGQAKPQAAEGGGDES